MIVGDPSVLAIESGITHAYERLSIRGLGYFVIYVGGRRYGVREAHATMLACSFDEVQERINDRGRHTAPFATVSNAAEIADAFRLAVYQDHDGNEPLFGSTLQEFSNLVWSNHLPWGPDGDEAFDDGSYILQFDVGDRVRLIGFKCGENGFHDPTTLSDTWLQANDFIAFFRRGMMPLKPNGHPCPSVLRTTRSRPGIRSERAPYFHFSVCRSKTIAVVK